MRKIDCIRYGENQEGIEYVPYPGDVGKKIFDQVSKKFWQEWLNHQVMFINENHYSPINPNDRKKIEKEMSQFLFEGEASTIEGYKPE